MMLLKLVFSLLAFTQDNLITWLFFLAHGTAFHFLMVSLGEAGEH